MIYLLTRGEYSDFSVEAVYEGPPGLKMQDLLLAYVKENNLHGRCLRSGFMEFDYESQALQSWLETRYGLKPADYEPLHNRGWRDFELEPETVAKLTGGSH